MFTVTRGNNSSATAGMNNCGEVRTWNK